MTNEQDREEATTNVRQRQSSRPEKDDGIEEYDEADSLSSRVV